MKFNFNKLPLSSRFLLIGLIMLIFFFVVLLISEAEGTKIHELVHRQIFNSFGVDAEIKYNYFNITVNKTNIVLSSPLFGGYTEPNSAQYGKLNDEDRRTVDTLNLMLHTYDYPEFTRFGFYALFIMISLAIFIFAFTFLISAIEKR